MDAKLNSVKALLERVEQYKWKKVGYDDRHQEYLWAAPFCPQEQMPIGAALEPVVPAPEWNLGDNAQLTVNHYNALVLNSKNMLILDVDFADRRFNKWATANLHQLIGYMHDLAALDAPKLESHVFMQELAAMDPVAVKPEDDFMHDLAVMDPNDLPMLWSKQTWEIFTTEHGARVILTSIPFPLDDSQNRTAFKALAAFLGADPVYSQKCLEQRCYRARLTPKHDKDVPVCLETHLHLWSKSKPHSDLVAQLVLHDEVAGYDPVIARIEAENGDSMRDDESEVETIVGIVGNDGQ